MRERKFVKLRVDMYGDTKFKIIDTMDERDLIHYIWTRLLTLAGKVNLAGDLYMSKSIPYTLETLAIEFNRSTEKVQLALDVFRDLEMIELTEDNIYRVKNFAKHQNIKVEEKTEKVDDKKEIKGNNLIDNQLFEENKKIFKKCGEDVSNKKLNNEPCLEISNICKDIIKENIENNCEKYNKVDVNSDSNLLSNKDKNKKKTKKSKKKLNNLEELCFEEEESDTSEWSDKPKFEGEVVRVFNFL